MCIILSMRYLPSLLALAFILWVLFSVLIPDALSDGFDELEELDIYGNKK